MTTPEIIFAALTACAPKTIATTDDIRSYSISVPACPATTDGIYVLQATVSNGAVTYNWVLAQSVNL